MATLDTAIAACYRSVYGASTSTFSSIINPTSMLEFGPAKFMVVDLDEDLLELPCVYKYFISKELWVNSTKPINVERLFIPMVCTHVDAREGKSSLELLKHFFTKTPYYNNLSKKKIAGTWYIGGEGLVLYDNFTPLIMFTLQVKRVANKANSTLFKYAPLKKILRVNPVVFTEQDIFSKYVKNKLIPNLAVNRLSSGYYNTFRNVGNILTTSYLDNDFTVIIEDFSYFFTNPSVPDGNFNHSKVIEALNKNVNQID